MEPRLIPIPVNAPGVLEFNYQRDLIWLLVQAVTFAVPLVLLFTGWGTRLRTACSVLAGNRGWLTLILFAAAYLVIVAIAVLPAAYWLEVAHRVAWGRPAQSVGDWITGRGVGLLTQIIGAALVLWIPFALIRRFPRWWWIPAAALAWAAACIAITVEQVWVRPLTTHIEPLVDGPLKTKFDAIAARCQTQVPVFVVDYPDEATVVGVGPTSRIYLSRQYVDDANARGDAQLLTTFAHELKHHRMNDNMLAFGVAALVILAIALLVHILGNAAIALWKSRFGFDRLSDAAALPLMLAILFFAWTFGGQLVFNAVQKHVEVEADRFALEVSRDNRGRALSIVETTTSPEFRVNDYYWFFDVFRATHPSDAWRIDFANTYRPWETGQPGRYDRICDPPN